VSTVPRDVLAVLIPVALAEPDWLAGLEAAPAPDDGLLAFPGLVAALLPHAARKTTAAAAPDAAHHRVRIVFLRFVIVKNLLHP
jgi:hypothetical protein